MKKIVLSAKYKAPGMQLNGKTSKIGCQPPKNKTPATDEINIILLYSAKKNNANPIAEYSTLYPDTSSASASGKSKGCRLVSAKALIKNITNIGNNGNAYQTLC
jgi:hypothetical protein